MSTENTLLKNTTPAGDSNTTNKMVIGKINTYHRTFLIVAGSLLALLVLFASAGTNSGQHLQSSVNEIAEGNAALADNDLGYTPCHGKTYGFCDRNVPNCKRKRKDGKRTCVCVGQKRCEYRSPF